MKLTIEKTLTVALGILWLVDGILQFQPPMFTRAFIKQVLVPNLQSQPRFAEAVISFGIHVFSSNIFLFNLASALVQIVIGLLLVFPLSKTLKVTGLWISIFWSLTIWVFGEGFGNLFTGSATFYSGAPGSALLYLIIAVFLLLAMRKEKVLNILPVFLGYSFIALACLNLTPMFWQTGMLSMIASIPSISSYLGTLGPNVTAIGNLMAMLVLLFLGAILVSYQNRLVARIAIIFLIIVWVVGQNFGQIYTFPTGTATDPNSAPLFMLFLLPIFFQTKDLVRRQI